jgi:hypothetical protein
MRFWIFAALVVLVAVGLRSGRPRRPTPDRFRRKGLL